MKYNLGFGYPTAVLQVLNDMYTPKLITSPVLGLEYPAYEGKIELINHLKKHTGKKYIIVTNGAIQAANIVIRSLRNNEYRNNIVTNKYTFPYYANAIEKSNLNHSFSDSTILLDQNKTINLIDMPTAYMGKLHNINDLHNNTIHDSVYNNQVYINKPIITTIKSRMEIGSLSKLFGVSGIRIGYIATDIKSDYEIFLRECKYENCGISVPSQDIAVDILNKLDMDRFTTKARNVINYNREEFLRLNRFFDNQEIPENGMFVFFWIDNKGLSIIDRAGVEYITFESGLNRKLIRFNMAQDNFITKKAVRSILSI